MKKNIFLIFIIITICTGNISAQTLLRHFELGGNIFYNYSYTTSPNGPDQKFNSKEHEILLQPELGYFVTHEFEILADIEYSYQYSHGNSFVGNEDGTAYEEIYSIHTNRIAIFLGAEYNYYLSEMFDFFGGLRYGFSAHRLVMNRSAFFSYDSKWRNEEVYFPSLFAGVKIHISPEWALIFKAQYIKTKNHDGYYFNINDEVKFGIGFAAYF